MQSNVLCFGTMSGVFGINSSLCLLPYGKRQAAVCQHLSQNQLEDAYSTGEVTKVGKRAWLGETVVVMRPNFKGGLCYAVWLAAWGSILLSLNLGQIFVGVLEKITYVESLDVGIQDKDTITL